MRCEEYVWFIGSLHNIDYVIVTFMCVTIGRRILSSEHEGPEL
jgi:hypothetical protein